MKVSTVEETLAFVKIKLINLNNGDTLFKRTDFEGFAIFRQVPQGFYQVVVLPDKVHQFQYLDSIEIINSDTVHLKISAQLCNLNYDLKDCSICKSDENVIRVAYGMHVNYQFDSERKRIKFVKKVRKQGFRTSEESENEFLILILDDHKDSLLINSSLCDKYLFCKKHQKVFQ